jgi:hypothetical protein
MNKKGKFILYAVLGCVAVAIVIIVSVLAKSRSDSFTDSYNEYTEVLETMSTSNSEDSVEQVSDTSISVDSDSSTEDVSTFSVNDYPELVKFISKVYDKFGYYSDSYRFDIRNDIITGEMTFDKDDAYIEFSVNADKVNAALYANGAYVADNNSIDFVNTKSNEEIASEEIEWRNNSITASTIDDYDWSLIADISDYDSDIETDMIITNIMDEQDGDYVIHEDGLFMSIDDSLDDSGYFELSDGISRTKVFYILSGSIAYVYVWK